MKCINEIAAAVADVVARLEIVRKDSEATADFYANLFCAVRGVEIVEVHDAINSEIRKALDERVEVRPLGVVDCRVYFGKNEIKVDGGDGVGLVRTLGDWCEVSYNNEFIAMMSSTHAAIGQLIKIITFFKALDDENI